MTKIKQGYYLYDLPETVNPLILEPEDMNEHEWKFICKLFTGTNHKKTQVIKISQKGIEFFISNEKIKYKR